MHATFGIKLAELQKTRKGNKNQKKLKIYKIRWDTVHRGHVKFPI